MEFLYATIVDSGQFHSDLTGRLPTTSARGNKNVLVLYDYDTNNILTEPMKSRGDQEMVRAYNKLIQELVDHGFKPPLRITTFNRYYRIHINKTKADRIVDTLYFFPANVTMPRTSSKDMVTIASQELTHAIMHPSPAATFSIIGGSQLEALQQLATIFNATIPPSATGGSVLIASSTNTNPPSAPSGSSSQPTPACAPNTPPLPRATIPPQATPRRQPVCSPTVCPRPAQYPRVDPSRSPAPSMRLPQAPSPRVDPSRSPPPSARLSQAPSPRVGPRRAPAPGARLSQAPSPRVRPTRLPPHRGLPQTSSNVLYTQWRKPPQNTTPPN
jgi:hypothetical protein